MKFVGFFRHSEFLPDVRRAGCRRSLAGTSFRVTIFILFLVSALVFPGLHPVFSQEEALSSMTYTVRVPYEYGKLIVTYGPIAPAEHGIASWYSETDPGIRPTTANGEIFDDSLRTCASWTYAFGTHLEVTNLANGKSVVCRVNDRGPAKRLNRVIDLTKEAFREIASLKLGLIEVAIRKRE